MILGIFDSGIGGLTVLKEILKKNSFDKIIYFGDTARLPYGEKSKEELLDIAKENVDFLLSKGAEKIVIACGTVSSNVLEELKKDYNIEIIGIVDALIEGAKEKTINNKIGIIATSATIKTHIFKNKLNGYHVYEMSCPKFTPLIESGKLDSKEMNDAINEYLKPLKDEGVDTLILGCTHYPILSKKIKKYFDYPINLINSGVIIADNLFDGKIKNPELEIYCSGSIEDFKNNSKYLEIENINEIKKY